MFWAHFFGRETFLSSESKIKILYGFWWDSSFSHLHLLTRSSSQSLVPGLFTTVDKVLQLGCFYVEYCLVRKRQLQEIAFLLTVAALRFSRQSLIPRRGNAVMSLPISACCFLKCIPGNCSVGHPVHWSELVVGNSLTRWAAHLLKRTMDHFTSPPYSAFTGVVSLVKCTSSRHCSQWELQIVHPR